MPTDSSPEVKDLSPIYLKTDKAHASGKMMFEHFNNIHNTLFASGSSEYASGHNPALYIDDDCVGNTPPIRSWTVNDDGALVIDNSNLSLNQGTIGGYRVEDFHESQQQRFRGLLDLIEYHLSITNEQPGETWKDVANSFSIGGIAKHRDISSIRALLDFAGHLSPEIELGFDDEDNNEGTFYDWGEEFGNSWDPADICVWNEIRAAWYCCFNLVDPKVEPAMENIPTRPPMPISIFELLARPPVIMHFPRLSYYSKTSQRTESWSQFQETYKQGDDKDMVALRGCMETLNTEVKDSKEILRDGNYWNMKAINRGYGKLKPEATEEDYKAMVARYRDMGLLKTEVDDGEDSATGESWG
jgi:hypothetical protein